MKKGIVLLTAVSAALFAAHAFADDYRAPRLPDGTPDLQGVWTNATATPMERSPELGERRAFTEQEAAASACMHKNYQAARRRGGAS